MKQTNPSGSRRADAFEQLPRSTLACRPSIDVAIRRAGGMTIAQDEATYVVYAVDEVCRTEAKRVTLLCLCGQLIKTVQKSDDVAGMAAAVLLSVPQIRGYELSGIDRPTG